MAGRVFISCGQSNPQEIEVATQISTWLSLQGFNSYVAIQTESILELNTGIITELKRSDFYLFINFRREYFQHRWFLPSRKNFYRGSVFTNQELAIAYALQFDRMLFLNQKGVRRDGLFRYIGSNTPEFSNFDQILPIVQQAITNARWDNAYSRNLDFRNLNWSGPFLYEDHTGLRNVKALHIDILNNRPDIGASNCVVRLNKITHNGIITDCPDKNHLKCRGFQGYLNVIWPSNHCSFDLLSIDISNQSNIFLHSAADIHPRQPVISAIGHYLLHYQVFAEDFPINEFTVDLNATGNIATTTAQMH